MKVSLSRKGIDSSSGRMASPILPCGCLCPIPIPEPKPGDRSKLHYSDILFGTRTLQEICSELNPDWQDGLAHLDPDLRADALASRHPGNWSPAFGQSDSAAGHLINQCVGLGDIFVFFGWFRRTRKKKNGELEFDPDDTDGRHIVYGWLEVGEVVCKLPLPAHLLFLSAHPHVGYFERGVRRNRIYVASQSGLSAGLFSGESAIVLTKEGERHRTQWSLDEAFQSLSGGGLSYHGNKECWQIEGRKVLLRAASKGQEFVFDGDEHPNAYRYLVDRIKAASNKKHFCSHEF